MRYQEHWSRTLFMVSTYTLLIVLALLCLFPLVHVLAVSFSSPSAASSGQVVLWPIDATLGAYEYALGRPQFIDAFTVSLKRVVLGTVVNMVLTILVAYPLSKSSTAFPARTWYVWFFVLTMLFSGGLIPLYMVVREMQMLDSIWALVLPTALPVFNVVLLLNFFRNIPVELEEAAIIDGASHWRILWEIYLPLSKPAIATLTLFVVVFHWNSWFDGLIFMNSPANYPLQSYLQTLVQQDLFMYSTSDPRLLEQVSNRTLRAAQIFLAALPILALYPFLQRYFVKGVVLGSVKG